MYDTSAHLQLLSESMALHAECRLLVHRSAEFRAMARVDVARCRERSNQACRESQEACRRANRIIAGQ